MHIEVFPEGGVTAGASWYWHFRNKGRVTADSESFTSKGHAIRAGKAVVRAVIIPSVVDGLPPNFFTVAADPKRPGVTVIRWG